VHDHRPGEVALLEPTHASAHERLAALEPVRLVRGTLFLTHPSEFADWAEGRRRLVNEDFYRWQRRRLDLLIDAGEPAGGRWNFDAQNREPPPDWKRPPRPYVPREDPIDREVRRDLDALSPHRSASTRRAAGPRRAWRHSAR
jgi:(6-4)DNA photolyase